MGQPLFTFEDDFISSMCMGSNDAEVRGRWVDAFDAGALEIERAVQEKARGIPAMKAHAKRLRVTLERGSYVVVVPKDIEAEVMAHEMGDGTQQPVPTLRGGLIRGAGAAGKAISDSLEMT